MATKNKAMETKEYNNLLKTRKELMAQMAKWKSVMKKYTAGEEIQITLSEAGILAGIDAEIKMVIKAFNAANRRIEEIQKQGDLFHQ